LKLAPEVCEQRTAGADERHPRKQGLKRLASDASAGIACLADERHPRKQGLKPLPSFQERREAAADERHPRQQGLKPQEQEPHLTNAGLPMSVIQENKD